MRLFFVLLLSTVLLGCVTLDTHNAKAWEPVEGQVSVIFQNDKGLVIQEPDGLHTPYMFYTNLPPSQDEISAYYQYNFKTQGIDEREGRALKVLAGTMLADTITTKVGLRLGCREANQLFKSGKIVPMLLYDAGNLGIFAIAAHSSTIYQSTLKHDTRWIYGGALFKGALSAKNLWVIKQGC